MGSVLLDLWMRDTGEIAKRISEKEARGEDVTEDRAELLRLLNQMDRYDQMRRERREKGPHEDPSVWRGDVPVID